MFSNPRRIIDPAVAGLVFVVSLIALLATTDIGFTRDEGFYFRAASLYVGWFEELWMYFQEGNLSAAFTRRVVDDHWSYNPEHPVLMKAAFALSHKLWHETLGVMGPSTAWRFPAMVSASALLSGIYLFGRDLAGRLAGLVAVAALLFQPRFFFHAHLACFDVPITAFWFWVAYAYWKSFDSGRWALACGVLFGLGLSVKLNAFFLPLVLATHWGLTRWREFRFSTGDHGPALSLPPIPKAFWAMLALGPLLFYALWPRLWFDTFDRFRWYLDFHSEHEHYFVYFFGQNLQVPPFPISYPWVMTLVTVPLVVLVAAAVGGFAYFRESGQWARWKEAITSLKQHRWPAPDGDADRRGTGALLALNVAIPIALISMPNTPIFGGTKHWMTAMPFVALLAGMGVARAVRAFRPYAERLGGGAELIATPVFAGLLTVSVVAPSLWATTASHPHGTSYYNSLIGGQRGAADRRMMRQFWGHSSRHALPWLNEHAPEGASLWNHNTIGKAWRTYREEALVRPDLEATSMGASDYALYHQQKAFNYQLLPLWEEYQTMAPRHVVDIRGVPLLSIYAREEPRHLKHPEVWR